MVGEKKILLISSDGKEFACDSRIVKKSFVLRTLLEDVGEISDAIPLPNVDGKILEKVLKWSEFHLNDLPYQQQQQQQQQSENDDDYNFGFWDEELEGSEGWTGNDLSHKSELNTETSKALAMDPWDVEFCSGMDHKTLFDVIIAANYLNVKGLIYVTCKYVSNVIRGKSHEEIRKMFNIQTDFTSEQLESIKKQNEWLF